MLHTKLTKFLSLFTGNRPMKLSFKKICLAVELLNLLHFKNGVQFKLFSTKGIYIPVIDSFTGAYVSGKNKHTKKKIKVYQGKGKNKNKSKNKRNKKSKNKSKGKAKK